MKKILIIFCVIASFTSCKNDLLDTYPYDKVGSENMWTTESLADQGVTGIYQALKQNMIAGKIDQLEAFGVSGNNVWLWGGSTGLLTGFPLPRVCSPVIGSNITK